MKNKDFLFLKRLFVGFIQQSYKPLKFYVDWISVWNV